MNRFTYVFALLVAGTLCAQRASAAPGDWFEYTNETGNNDPTDINNWRWAHDSSMPVGVSAWRLHPTSYAQLTSTRMFLSGAGSGLTANNPTDNYSVADDGNGKTFNLVTNQVDGGMTLNVHGTGVLTADATAANGLGLNVLRDMPTALGGDGWGNTQRYYRPTGAVTTLPNLNKNWFGNNLDTTIHVYNGGTFNNAGGSNGGVDSGIGPIGHLGYDLDSTNGKIIVTLGGAYPIGSINNNKGGGFLTLRGYDPLTSITMGSMTINPANAGAAINVWSDTSAGLTGNYGLYGVSTGATDAGNVPAVAGNYLSNLYPTASPLNIAAGAPAGTFDSTAADLRVHLTAQNDAGLFNSVALTGALTMLNITASANFNTKPAFDLTLDGYTPVQGDEFSLITAGSFSGTGSFQQGWDTDFALGNATYELHNTRAGVPGVYLEVMNVAAVPEPSTFVLAVLGAFGLAGFGWNRRRATR